MMSLLKVELTRLRWRRAVLLLVAAAVLVPAVIWGATVWNTRPVSPDEQARVEQLVAEETQQPYVQRQLKQCLKDPGRYRIQSSEDVEARCAEEVLPRVEYYSSRSPLSLTQERRQGSGLGVIVVLTMLTLLIGTTFVGHDWNSGSMSNQLLFEPRRIRVWAAKGMVVLGTGFVLTGLVLTAYWSGLGLVAAHRDLDIPDGALSAAYEQGLRGALLAAFAGLGGYAMTMLFRSTVATLGIMFAIAIAGPLMITLLGFPGHERWMPQNNFAAVALDRFVYFDESQPGCSGDGGGFYEGGGEECMVRLTRVDATAYFGGLLVLAGVPSVLLFRRRDVP